MNTGSRTELEAIVADIGARLERMKVWRKRFGEESPIVVNDLDPISALFTRCLSTISERMVDKAGASLPTETGKVGENCAICKGVGKYPQFDYDHHEEPAVMRECCYCDSTGKRKGK